MKAKEDKINNSYQILEEFSQRSGAYHCPLPRKKQRVTHYRGRSGKVKIYTEEEIKNYELNARK